MRLDYTSHLLPISLFEIDNLAKDLLASTKGWCCPVVVQILA